MNVAMENHHPPKKKSRTVVHGDVIFASKPLQNTDIYNVLEERGDSLFSRALYMDMGVLWGRGPYMSNRQNYCNTNLLLLRLGLSEVAQNLNNRSGTTLY